MIDLYSLRRMIDGIAYDFNIPCESFADAEHLALRIDCVVTGKLVESKEVCINCLKDPSVLEVPKVLYLWPKKLEVM